MPLVICFSPRTYFPPVDSLCFSAVIPSGFATPRAIFYGYQVPPSSQSLQPTRCPPYWTRVRRNVLKLTKLLVVWLQPVRRTSSGPEEQMPSFFYIFPSYAHLNWAPAGCSLYCRVKISKDAFRASQSGMKKGVLWEPSTSPRYEVPAGSEDFRHIERTNIA